MQPADIDDAVSSAMVDLFDYWLHLKSSITDDNPSRNFNFAITRGYWMASSFLYHTMCDSSRFIALDERVGHTPEMIQRGPEPEDFLQTEEQAVQDFLSTLPEDEYRSWLTDFLEGLTERQAAQRHGVFRNAIHERRTRGLRRIRERYHAYLVQH